MTTPRPTGGRSHDAPGAFAIAFAGLGPIVVAAALVGVRGELVNVNIALVLVVIVVLAAVAGGRAAGALAAVMSALSYEFFFTRPYLSLRIADAEDALTTVLLLVIGLAVGELVILGRRSRQAASRAQEGIVRLHRVAELAAGGARADDLVTAVEEELSALLELEDCRYESPPFGLPLARLERNGAVATSVHHLVGGEFALPAEGVELPVVGGGRQVGRLVLTPSPDVGVSLERRVVAVALSDQLGAALAPAAPVEPRSVRQDSDGAR